MTPSFNGFSARFQTALGNDSQYGATTGITLRRSGMQELGLSYAAGPLSASLAQLQVKTSPNEAAASATAGASSNVTTKTTTASVGYNMGVARLGAGISNIKNNAGLTTGGDTGATDTKSYLLTATVPMGATRLMASIGQRKTDGSAVTALEGKKTSFTGLAAEHDLSKRTFVYARYQTGKAGDVSAATVVINGVTQSAGQLSNTKFNLFAVGVSHAF
jgi:predicted porin